MPKCSEVRMSSECTDADVLYSFYAAHHDWRVRVAQHVEPNLLQLRPEVVAVLAQLGQLGGAAAGAVCVPDQLQRRDDLLRGRRRHCARVQLRGARRPQVLDRAPAIRSTPMSIPR